MQKTVLVGDHPPITPEEEQESRDEDQFSHEVTLDSAEVEEEVLVTGEFVSLGLHAGDNEVSPDTSDSHKKITEHIEDADATSLLQKENFNVETSAADVGPKLDRSVESEGSGLKMKDESEGSGINSFETSVLAVNPTEPKTVAKGTEDMSDSESVEQPVQEKSVKANGTSKGNLLKDANFLILIAFISVAFIKA